jgi:pimeloyl-ACP methyl ester carboxylesterase
MPDQSRRYFSSEKRTADRKLTLSRRRLCLSFSAAAVDGLAFAQSPTRAAIVRGDVAGLPPYGNSTLSSGIRSRLVTNINGLAMHVLEAGFETKGRECILLLHGFPELAYSWRKVMLPLAAAGYHVVAPDQRGYGRTTGWDDAYDGDLDSFRIPNLVRDALGLISALGYRSVAAVIGHDFGSPVAAYCAVIRPDVFRSVAMMSAPFAGPPPLPFNTADAPTPAATPAPSNVFEDLAKLDRPRKHYQQYYRTREANDNMWRAPQGIHAFLRAYYHFKSADWKQNQPFKLAAFTASELAKMPTYYIMDLGKGMA